MAKERNDNRGYTELKRDLRDKKPRRLYAFWGEERYLLEHYLGVLRKMIPEGTEEFNHRRLEGKNMQTNDLREAVDALPVFSQMTLTEVSDFDFSKTNEDTRRELLDILSDIPDYACVVFIFDTVEFKLDGRVKTNGAIKKLFNSVEFPKQEQSELTVWITRHMKALGKKISAPAAERLAFLTGGMMTSLINEIEKLSAYSRGDTVTVADIDAVVTPVLDAAAYELTDAILNGQRERAVAKLGELLMMDEAPHKILFSISAKLRQMLCAKACLGAGLGQQEFMEMCSIRYPFQARGIITAARGYSVKRCCQMVRLSSKAAYLLNSSSQDPEKVLQELVVRLMYDGGSAG